MHVHFLTCHFSHHNPPSLLPCPHQILAMHVSLHLKRVYMQSSGNATTKCNVQPNKDQFLMQKLTYSVNEAKASQAKSQASLPSQAPSHSEQADKASLSTPKVKDGNIAEEHAATVGTSLTLQEPPGSISTWQNWNLA
jgi:hypothetical protein